MDGVIEVPDGITIQMTDLQGAPARIRRILPQRPDANGAVPRVDGRRI